MVGRSASGGRASGRQRPGPVAAAARRKHGRLAPVRVGPRPSLPERSPFCPTRPRAVTARAGLRHPSRRQGAGLERGNWSRSSWPRSALPVHICQSARVLAGLAGQDAGVTPRRTEEGDGLRRGHLAARLANRPKGAFWSCSPPIQVHNRGDSGLSSFLNRLPVQVHTWTGAIGQTAESRELCVVALEKSSYRRFSAHS